MARKALSKHLTDTRLYPEEKGGELMMPDSMEVLQVMAEARQEQLRIPRTVAFKREQVIEAFQDSFELIGGVPRLAAWAHENPSAFFRLYAKLLPSTAQKQISHDGQVTVLHAIAPGPLDALPISSGQAERVEDDDDDD